MPGKGKNINIMYKYLKNKSMFSKYDIRRLAKRGGVYRINRYIHG